MRNFETKIIPKLLRKKGLLFSVVLLFQFSIYCLTAFPLWWVRAKETVNAALIGYDSKKMEMALDINRKDAGFFSPGKQVEILINDSAVSGIVAKLSQSKEGGFITLRIKYPSPLGGEPVSGGGRVRGEIKLVTRGERILALLWGKWRGKI